ncbi:cytochrome c oxidase assembly protein [Bermanella marisrubri]|uniref:Cytochrome c oxidase assembly protein CtaG n=1 Tax=Bermanella marisrubri TaxID=207949 RepID=Q1N2M5_9GAMM|nr:cytochrome c oxidase assembly protein [Bermanella marisrubri]EAT12382.1 Cytochrome c oxidase assembly protein CtaG/Cox11 [Oceanobacter sp. RED65] [Bermanella marisrubri]QIZ85465.1 cytochrome c oxidase assembly protein [Bermanella marisrubri]
MNKLSAWKLALVPIAMFGFGFALVPLYDIFCEVTGLNGKNFQVGQESAEVDTSVIKHAKLQFLADPNSRDQWQFKPEHKSLQLTSGDMILTYYELTNPTDETVTVQAVPSVAPGEWAEYLVKIECFCFNQQVIEPGATVKLPLQVTLSAKAPEDVNHLSLSYRIYRS